MLANIFCCTCSSFITRLFAAKLSNCHYLHNRHFSGGLPHKEETVSRSSPTAKKRHKFTPGRTPSLFLKRFCAWAGLRALLGLLCAFWASPPTAFKGGGALGRVALLFFAVRNDPAKDIIKKYKKLVYETRRISDIFELLYYQSLSIPH